MKRVLVDVKLGSWLEVGCHQSMPPRERKAARGQVPFGYISYNKSRMCSQAWQVISVL